MTVKCATEDVGESQDIVDLIGIVASSCGHDKVVASSKGEPVVYLRVRIGEGEYDRSGSHFQNHGRCKRIRHAQTEKDIGILYGFRESMQIAFGNKLAFVFVDICPVLTYNALGVAHHNILTSYTEPYIVVCTADSGGTGAVDNEFYIFNLLSLDFEGVKKSGSGNDGCAVLVIVHHRNVTLFFEFFFYSETFRSLYIFEVDTSESFGNRPYGRYEFLGILLIYFYVERIDTCEYLEKKRFSLHDRF